MQIITNQLQREQKEHGSSSFPLLISKECISNYDKGSFLWHWHPEIEITRILHGEMFYQINQETYHLKQGQALFCNTKALHTGYQCNNSDCEYTSITFNPKLIYGSTDHIIYIKFVEPLLNDFTLNSLYFDNTQDWHMEIISTIKEIENIYTNQNSTYELRLTIALQTFWDILFRNKTTTHTFLIQDQIAMERLRAIMSYISEHYAHKISLEEIATHINLCTSECSRLFKRYMNVPLFSFLQEYRIEKSLDYLSNTYLTITEISSLVGFSDPNYYSKTFHKYKNISPQKYRQQNKIH